MPNHSADPPETSAAEPSPTSPEYVVRTEELASRKSREPSYESESRALVRLVEALADAPHRILQTLAEEILNVVAADSAGVSLLTSDGMGLLWPGIAGRWKPRLSGGALRDIGPLGDVTEHNVAQVLRDGGERSPCLLRLGPPATECLLVPFSVAGEVVGMLCAAAEEERRFDAEDLRQLESLARFASAAHEVAKREQTQDARRAALNLLEDAAEARESLEVRNEQLRARSDELLASEHRLSAELEAAERLQHVATELVQAEASEHLYEQLLDTAKALMKADFASIQMLHPERGGEVGELRLLAFRGFTAEAAKSWEWVCPGSDTTCGVALKTRKRVIVSDVTTCAFMAGTEHLATYLQTGIHAMQSTPLISGSGRLVGMVSTHWREPHVPDAVALGRLDVLARLSADVIERSQSARALRESEERYRTLVSAITDVPWTTDVEGAFVTPQPAWAAFTGQTWEEYRGFGWAQAIHEEDREHVQKLWAAACKSRTDYESNGRFWHAASASYRHFVARATPVLRDNSVAEWVGTCTDVTAERQVAQEREELLSIAERARGEAERANHTKDEFLAIVSHELRSPINAMLGWLRILKTAGTRDPNLVSKAADTIERNIWLQAQVINDLLDVSRIISGKLQLERERVEVVSVVMGCVESLRPSAEGKQVALRVKVGREESDVIGDGGRIQQVVGNLLGNAIKFTDAGGFITVSVDGTDTEVTISVADTGHGIPPDTLPHIFERFWQADSSTARKHGGLGLGLAIVRHVVEQHGGSVEVESAGSGRGARFTVTLPRAVERSRVAFQPPRPTPGGEEQPFAVDVLLVEDDADSRLALELALEESGVHVRSASTVRQALEAYNAQPPDVLVTDIGMPGEDGYVLIRAIREREEGRPHRTLAIAMTGFAGRQDREMALRAGFDEHVGKPVEPDTLLERLRVLKASQRGGGGGRVSG